MAAFAGEGDEEMKWQDTNIGMIGSEEDCAARKAAAATDEQWAGAGEQAGLEIWRVENRRTENDTPDFGVKRWPREEYGHFYSGDSYLVMNTIIDDEGAKSHDLHFWLGEKTTQDEMGVAAYKTVELDDLLDGVPVQYREVMGHESTTFLSYFPFLKYMDGGIESGFRKVQPEEYVPRLLHVSKQAGSKVVRVRQVELALSSLNQGDAFVLDAGTKVYVWFGENSSAFEKAKAGNVQSNLIGERHGKAVKGDEETDEFWEYFGGRGEISNEEKYSADPIEMCNHKLFRLSDESGSLEFSKVAEGKFSQDLLDSSDVFIVDAGVEIFAWVGSAASPMERRKAVMFAGKYLTTSGLPQHTRITRVIEGARKPTNFDDAFTG
jgi:gelsolin